MPFTTQAEFDRLPEFHRVPLEHIAREAERLTGPYVIQEGPNAGRMAPHPPYEQYMGQRFAGPQEDSERAARMTRTGVGIHQPYLKQAQHLTREAATPFTERYQQYMNPYESHVINQISEEGMRHLNEKLLPALQNKYTNLGQYGGTRHAKMSREVTRDVISEILNRQNQARASGYFEAAKTHAADQAKALEAARGMGDLGALAQGSRMADIAALSQQGKEAQAHQQSMRDWLYEDWIRANEHPYNLLQYKANLMARMPQERFMSSYRQQAPSPHMNAAGGIGQMAMNLLGMRMANRGQ